MAAPDLFVDRALQDWREAYRKAHAAPIGVKRERARTLQDAMTRLLTEETQAKRGRKHDAIKR